MAQRSLASQLNAAAAAAATPGGSLQVGEVNINAANANDDDARSTTSMNTVVSSASTFARGNRDIDIYLRNGKTAIDAAVTQWLATRKPFDKLSQEDVEKMGEEACSAAEDADQLRCETGENIRKWISTARLELNKNDPDDRRILHRVCTFVDRKRRQFDENGLIMTRTATTEMRRSGIFQSANYILPEMDPKGTAKRDADDISQLSPILEEEDRHVKKKVIINTVDNVSADPQDDLHVGSSADDLMPPRMNTGPLNRRSRSPHAEATISAMAEEMEKERREQEEALEKQRQALAKAKEDLQLKRQREAKAAAEKKRIAEQQKEAAAKAAAISKQREQEKATLQKEMEAMEKQKRAARAAFEEEMAAAIKDLQQMQLQLDQPPAQDDLIHLHDENPFIPVNRRRSRKSPPKPPTPSATRPWEDTRQFLDSYGRGEAGATGGSGQIFEIDPRNPLDAATAHHNFRRANNLVDPSFTIAMSEESTMRKRMMALQRAKEARPVEKFAKGNHIAYRNLMTRFDIAVADDSIEDRSRILELIH